MRRAPEPPKGDKPEKVIEYRVINGVFRGTLKISERRGTRDERRMTSAPDSLTRQLPTTPKGDKPERRLVGAVGVMGRVGAVGELGRGGAVGTRGGVGMVGAVGGVVVFDVK